ncbi:uncharacterized protein MONBRDRAFT_5084 [Monosiga brevicollis MX1]|uniref:YbaK/aminoacyl-tRNA synthetase-associated domain-containing protein n=1 Tax=Monosiga brevicollis TaxID=81824 RepID=A9UPV8_MONBE|nr:uncharacterized protein MONBRDRAFT_5084 [Monosiga brevicollis MX1]EDQ92487.1 predicted protein [Monosiga brevicollis MX1]|eukprot:XP_001742249.1 hypothetical protein [Monosiga brevicollis MX1]
MSAFYLTVFGLRSPETEKHQRHALNCLYGASDAAAVDDSSTSDLPPEVQAGADVQRLDQLEIRFRHFAHPPEKKKDVFVLIFAAADTNVRLPCVQSHFKLKNMRMAASDVLETQLQLKGGAVTPLGLINDPGHAVHVVLDSVITSSLEQEVLLHPIAGNHHSLVMSVEALLRFIQSCGHPVHVADFAAERLAPL